MKKLLLVFAFFLGACGFLPFFAVNNVDNACADEVSSITYSSTVYPDSINILALQSENNLAPYWTLTVPFDLRCGYTVNYANNLPTDVYFHLSYSFYVKNDFNDYEYKELYRFGDFHLDLSQESSRYLFYSDVDDFIVYNNIRTVSGGRLGVATSSASTLEKSRFFIAFNYDHTETFSEINEVFDFNSLSRLDIDSFDYDDGRTLFQYFDTSLFQGKGNPLRIIRYTYTDLYDNQFYFELADAHVGDYHRTIYFPNGASGDAYYQGYSEGRRDGLEEGNRAGYNSGYSKGFELGDYNGYRRGLAEQDTESFTFFGLFASLIDAPLKALDGLFNFEIPELGLNLASLFASVFTCAIGIAIIKLIL